MMKIFSRIIFALCLVSSLVLSPLPAGAAVCSGSPVDCVRTGKDKVGGNSAGPSLEDNIKSIVNILLFILGAIAVIMIIIGGIRYTTSNGEAQQITSAKNTVLYAVIGIAIALIAYAIVNFVVEALSGSGTSGAPSP